MTSRKSLPDDAQSSSSGWFKPITRSVSGAIDSVASMFAADEPEPDAAASASEAASVRKKSRTRPAEVEESEWGSDVWSESYSSDSADLEAGQVPSKSKGDEAEEKEKRTSEAKDVAKGMVMEVLKAGGDKAAVKSVAGEQDAMGMTEMMVACIPMKDSTRQICDFVLRVVKMVLLLVTTILIVVYYIGILGVSSDIQGVPDANLQAFFFQSPCLGDRLVLVGTSCVASIETADATGECALSGEKYLTEGTDAGEITPYSNPIFIEPDLATRADFAANEVVAGLSLQTSGAKLDISAPVDAAVDIVLDDDNPSALAIVDLLTGNAEIFFGNTTVPSPEDILDLSVIAFVSLDLSGEAADEAEARGIGRAAFYADKATSASTRPRTLAGLGIKINSRFFALDTSAGEVSATNRLTEDGSSVTVDSIDAVFTFGSRTWFLQPAAGQTTETLDAGIETLMPGSGDNREVREDVIAIRANAVEIQTITAALSATLVAVDAQCIDQSGNGILSTYSISGLAALIVIPLQYVLVILVTFKDELVEHTPLGKRLAAASGSKLKELREKLEERKARLAKRDVQRWLIQDGQDPSMVPDDKMDQLVQARLKGEKAEKPVELPDPTEQRMLVALEKWEEFSSLIVSIVMIILTAYIDGAFVLHKLVDNASLYYTGSSGQTGLIMVGLLSPAILVLFGLLYVLFARWSARLERKWSATEASEGKGSKAATSGRDLETGLNLPPPEKLRGLIKQHTEAALEGEPADEAAIRQAKGREKAIEAYRKEALEKAKKARQVVSKVKKAKAKAKKNKTKFKFASTEEEKEFLAAEKVQQPAFLTPARLRKTARGMLASALAVFTIVALFGFYVKFVQGLPAAISGEIATTVQLVTSIVDIVYILISVILIFFAIAKPR